MMEETRIIGRAATEEDRQYDQSLRPKTLDEYIGQSKVKEKMRIFMRAAIERNEPLDHVLLYGPPGIGKTALANIISAEMGVNLRVTSGPAIEKPKDLAGLLTNLEAGDVLFIDEIHRLNHTVEEVLYPALEDFALDIMLGMGPSARSIRIDLPRFTVVGATTRAGLLTGPLRDRFGIINRLELYNTTDLQTIVERSAGILHIPIEHEGSHEIARRARGTPRIANRLLRRVRDYAQIKADGVITLEAAKGGLEMMEVDEFGLDNVDRNILAAVIDKFGGGPVGLETLSASTGEESSTIEDVIEPFLMQLGFLSRTPRGRIATARAFEHMGLKPPASVNGLGQVTLFEE